MRGFWVQCTGGKGGYVDAEDHNDAKRIAEHITLEDAIEVQPIPAPAKPIIYLYAHPVDGLRPISCRHPARCAGKTECPLVPCCSEARTPKELQNHD